MKYTFVINDGVFGKYMCSSRLSLYSEISRSFFGGREKGLELVATKV